MLGVAFLSGTLALRASMSETFSNLLSSTVTSDLYVQGPKIAGNGNNVFTANLPVGVGMKYKLGERMNLNIDWTMHFTMSDKLDGAVDPYNIKSSGIFKNNDCYSVLQVSITYSFKEKCRVCHNQDE